MAKLDISQFLPLTGGTLTGNLTIASGVGIIAATSGSSAIGSASNPFEAIYVDAIISSGSALVQEIASSGAGVSLYNTKVSTVAYMNSISGVGTITVDASVDGLIKISGSSAAAGVSSVNSLAGVILVSGAGSVSVAEEGNTIIVSGSATGSSSITTPDSTTSFGIAIWSGNSGSGLLNTNIIISDNGNTLNAPAISGTVISGENFFGINISGQSYIFTSFSGSTTHNTFLLDDPAYGMNLSSDEVYLHNTDESGYILIQATETYLDSNGTTLIYASGNNGINVTDSEITTFHSVSPATSGIDDLGSPTKYFDNFYVNTVNVAEAVVVGSLDGVLFATSGLVSGSATTTQLPEGVNLYFTETRARAVVSGTSPITVVDGLVSITNSSATTSGSLTSTDWNTFNAGATNASTALSQIATVSGVASTNTVNIATVSGVAATNTTNIATVSGVASTNTTNIATVSGVASTNTTNIATVSGVASTNTVNIATVSGVAATNTGNISTNTTNIATVSGVASTNTTNIATVSGVAATNTVNIATVSGVASTAIQNATSSGVGYQIFNSKNGTDLVFNTISGTGAVEISFANGLITVSGTDTGGATTASNLGSGYGWFDSKSASDLRFKSITSGTNIVITSGASSLQIGVNDNPVFSTMYASVVSGTAISGSAIFDAGNRVVTSVNSLSGPSITLSTTNIAEGINQYYTNARVSGVIATQAGLPNGLATLNISGTIPNSQLPPLAITDVFVVTNFSDLLIAPDKQVGDVGIVASGSTSYILQTEPYTVSGNWIELLTPPDAVLSVNGQVGVVSLTTTDINEGTNLYYTDAKARAVVSGTAPISVNDGLVEITTASATVSGSLTSADWNTFNTGATNASTALSQIATVSGVAATAIQNAISSGTGLGIFNSKVGTNLVFNTISGDGSVVVSSAGGVLSISGSSFTPSAIAVSAPITNTAGTIGITTASAVTSGSLTSTDWGVFNTGATNASTALSQIATVSGVASTNTGNISTNTTNIATVSGIAATNTGNIAAVSGVAAQNTIDISTVSGVAATAIQNATSSGVGINIFNSKNGTDLVFNTISGTGAVEISFANGLIAVSGTDTGEANTASNLGSGYGWFDSKSASDLRFKSITSGTNIIITSGAASLQIGVNDNPVFSTMYASVVSGTAISGSSFFDDGVQIFPASAAAPITLSSGLIGITNASAVTSGSLTSTDWGVFSTGATNASTALSQIATVSGVAATAIQSGISLGGATSIFSAKNGTNLEFNSISGTGAVTISTAGNVVTISGTDTAGAQENYAFAYDTTTQTVGASNTFQDVTFNTNGEIDGWSHAASGANFTCPETARYLVSYDAVVQKTAAANATIELIAVLNGVEVAGSQAADLLNSNNRPQSLSKTFIVNATAAQVLKLQMAADSTNAEATPTGANATTPTSVVISITKV